MSSKDKNSNSNKMEVDNVDNDEEWEEESTYMIMDLGSDLTIDLLKRSLEINNGYSIIGLDTDQPMFKIGNFVYKGEVDYSLGTDLIFEIDDSKIKENKDNSSSSVYPPDSSHKQSSVYSYLTGEEPTTSLSDLPLIPLTQTTKKMVFHSVLLEQKDDELSGKDKLPDSLLPNLSPNTLFMVKDSILNSMAVGNDDISPISVTSSSSKLNNSNIKPKTTDKISLMDGISTIEKINNNKSNNITENFDLNSTDTSQILNPEISQTSNTETPEYESNEISQIINSEMINDIENNKIRKISDESINTDNNEILQTNDKDKSNNIVSVLSTTSPVNTSCSPSPMEIDTYNNKSKENINMDIQTDNIVDTIGHSQKLKKNKINKEKEKETKINEKEKSKSKINNILLKSELEIKKENQIQSSKEKKKKAPFAVSPLKHETSKKHKTLDKYINK